MRPKTYRSLVTGCCDSLLMRSVCHESNFKNFDRSLLIASCATLYSPSNQNMQLDLIFWFVKFSCLFDSQYCNQRDWLFDESEFSSWNALLIILFTGSNRLSRIKNVCLVVRLVCTMLYCCRRVSRGPLFTQCSKVGLKWSINTINFLNLCSQFLELTMTFQLLLMQVLNASAKNS